MIITRVNTYQWAPSPRTLFTPHTYLGRRAPHCGLRHQERRPAHPDPPPRPKELLPGGDTVKEDVGAEAQRIDGAARG